MQWIILIREADGRVVTLVEADPNRPDHMRTVVYDLKRTAELGAQHTQGRFGLKTSVVEAP